MAIQAACLRPFESVIVMPKSKLHRPMILTTIIEWDQHERLRELAFKERASMADLIREALERYLRSRAQKASR